MDRVTAPDGSSIVVTDEGSGPPILILHGGMSDEAPWAKVAALLAGHHRVVRMRRRGYRLDLAPEDAGPPFAAEVADALAVAAAVGEPCLLVGHSSGAVLALETLVADPRPFVGAVLYEPPAVLPGLPLGKPDSLPRMRAAVAARRPGRALRVFLADMVGLPRPMAALIGLLSRRLGLAPMVPRQVNDADAIVRLGDRLAAYEQISLPVLMVSGDRSPQHLQERTALLARRLPRARLRELPGQEHSAMTKAPDLLADLLTVARTDPEG